MAYISGSCQATRGSTYRFIYFIWLFRVSRTLHSFPYTFGCHFQFRLELGVSRFESVSTTTTVASLQKPLLGLFEVDHVPNGIEVLNGWNLAPYNSGARMLTSGLTFLY
jgi:hypothetical protein